jgi:hypothetical protein
MGKTSHALDAANKIGFPAKMKVLLAAVVSVRRWLKSKSHPARLWMRP